MDIAQIIIDFLMKTSVKPLERNPKFLKLLSHLKIAELKPDFDSIYTHALVEYSVDAVRLEVVKLFALKIVKKAFYDELYKNQSINFEKVIAQQLHSNKKVTFLRNIYPSIEALNPEIEKFRELFKHVTIRSSNPFELQKYNEFNQSMLKMLKMLEEQQKKSFDYQVKQYLSRLRDGFQKDFLDEKLYIDLNGETRVKKTRIDSAGSEIFDYCAEDIKKRPEYDYETIPHTPLDIAINEWLEDDIKNLLVIMGEYGTGKTTFCRYMAHQLASNHLEKGNSGAIMDRKNRIPLLLPLRSFEKTMDSFIINQFNKEGITDINFQIFLNRLDKGEFILLLDGFDEMTQKIDSAEKSRNFSKIQYIIERSSKSKILLTTREEYFQSEVEAVKVFKSMNKTNYRFVHLRPFDDNQIWQYLETHTEDPKYYWDQIKNIFDLHDMAKRPVLLEMILDCFPNLIKRKEQTESIKSSHLYETCIHEELQRKSDELVFIIPGKYRLKILQKLSFWMLLKDEDAIDVILMDKELNFRQYFQSKTDWEYERYMNEFLTFTFLIREGDNRYRISHKSFRDFLTAQGLLEEINSGELENFPRIRSPQEVIFFILELNPNKDRLLELVLTSRKPTEEKQWQGTNAATILLQMDNTILRNRDLSDCHLPYVDFRNCDLTDTNFKNTNLSHCSFNYTILTAQLDNVKIEHSFWDLSKQGITDLTRLGKLKQLNQLDLSYNQVRYLTPLSELQQLTKLDLNNNKITDITPLSESHQLIDLDLSYNRISDITPLRQLKQLTHLNLSYNHFSDLTPLEELELLTHLKLFCNLIVNISPLQELKQLTHLYLSGNQIKDLTPLKELNHLTQLNLFYNQITDLTPLRELIRLKELYIVGNQVLDVQKEALKKALPDLIIYD